jgi:hypothetical protein
MRKWVRLFFRLTILAPLLQVLLINCASARRNEPPQEMDTVVIGEVVSVPEQEGPPSTETPASRALDKNVVYEDLVNIVWSLCEIRIGHGKTELDREAMAENGMDDIYTLQLMDEGLSGKAAPNRYFTTYELRHNHDFRLRPIVGTMIAANINVGGLMENEYYWYLQRVNHWEIVNGALELYAYPSQNEEVVLRYLRR